MEGFSKPELRALLGAARDRSRRDHLMILMAFWHGLRASEVIAITANSIKDGYLTVKRLKGSLKTVQPLISHADPLLNERKLLFDYTRELPVNQRLFRVNRTTFWRIIQRHAKTAGIPAHKAHPHTLKHTIAAQSIQSAGIENTRQWLGHKSIASTGEYLRVTDGQAGKAVARALGARPL